MRSAQAERDGDLEARSEVLERDPHTRQYS
jgi:hypothetical protein